MVVQKEGGLIRLGRGAGVRHDRAVCVNVRGGVRIGWRTRRVHESNFGCFILNTQSRRIFSESDTRESVKSRAFQRSRRHRVILSFLNEFTKLYHLPECLLYVCLVGVVILLCHSFLDILPRWFLSHTIPMLA